MKAVSHDPAVLWTKGYTGNKLHGVAGNTNPWPSEPCAKLWVTLMLEVEEKLMGK